MLNELNKSGFGASIGKLKTFIKECQAGDQLGCSIIQRSEVRQYIDMLESLGENVQKYKDQPENKTNDLDEFKRRCSEFEGTLDIQAYAVVSGVNIFVDYENGHIDQIYTTLNNELLDLTDKLKGIVQNSIKEWEQIDHITVDGYIYIDSSNQSKVKDLGYININHAIVQFIIGTLDKNILDMLEFMAVDYQDDSGRLGRSMNDQMIQLREYFNIPVRAKLSGVTAQQLDKALQKMLRYFDNAIRTGQIKYETSKIRICNDNRHIRETYKLDCQVNQLWAKEQTVEKATVTSINWENSNERYEATLRLNSSDEFRQIDIREVQLRALDRNNITIGQKVNILRVSDGDSTIYKLCDSDMNIISQ